MKILSLIEQIPSQISISLISGWLSLTHSRQTIAQLVVDK